jgi:hypothetical protein
VLHSTSGEVLLRCFAWFVGQVMHSTSAKFQQVLPGSFFSLVLVLIICLSASLVVPFCLSFVHKVQEKVCL